MIFVILDFELIWNLKLTLKQIQLNVLKMISNNFERFQEI